MLKSSRMRTSILGPFAMLLMWMPWLSGCMVGPDYCRPPTPVPNQWHQPMDNAEIGGPEGLLTWWTVLNDPCLNELIDAADDGNLDLYAALQRITQAEAQVCIADSAKRLQIIGEANYRKIKQSTNAFGAGGFAFALGAIDNFNNQLNISWVPDVFGRIHRQVESASANMAASIEDYRGVMVTLYADVAASYVRIRTLQAQLKFAKQNLDLQERALELAKKRVEGGVSAILDQYQAEANLELTRALIPPAEAQLHQELNRLAVLLGRYPGTLHDCLATPAPIPDPNDTLPIVIPCDLVRQRPDIRRAERIVAARCADVGVAEAQLFPSFTIGGNFGLSSRNFSSLYESSSLSYTLGPQVSWPILAGGQILCNIHLADAALEESISAYQQSVLRGVQEVEDAIVLYRKERERYDSLKLSVVASEKQLDSVLKTYRAGKTDFLNVLNSLRTLFTAQNDLAVSEGQIVQNLITLYRALGGGWDPTHHCQDRTLRIHCQARGDARAVEKEIKFHSLASQYFEIPKEGPDSADRSDSGQTDQDSGAPGGSSSVQAPGYGEREQVPGLMDSSEELPALKDATDAPGADGADGAAAVPLTDDVLDQKINELELRLKSR